MNPLSEPFYDLRVPYLKNRHMLETLTSSDLLYFKFNNIPIYLFINKLTLSSPCDKRFVRRDELKRHVWIHSGEARYTISNVGSVMDPDPYPESKTVWWIRIQNFHF